MGRRPTPMEVFHLAVEEVMDVGNVICFYSDRLIYEPQ